MTEFLRRAGKNKRLRAVLRRFERLTLSTDQIIKEIERMHIARDVRKLKAEEVVSRQQNRLIRATLQNQAYRSRCVELKLQCWRRSSQIAADIADLRSYLKVYYRESLRREHGASNAAQDAAIDQLLAVWLNYVRELDTTVELADFIIDDIDKAAWALKAINDVMAVTTSGARNI